jgi:hypothetical protein
MLREVPSFKLEDVQSEYTTRLLEIVAITAGTAGMKYIDGVRDTLAAVEGNEGQGVIESAVELVLLHLRDGPHTLPSASNSPDTFSNR